MTPAEKNQLLSDIAYEGGKISEIYTACTELYHAGQESGQEGIATMAIALLDTKNEEHLAQLYKLLNGYFDGWETFKATQDKSNNGELSTESPELNEPLETSLSSAELGVDVQNAEKVELSEGK